jgi:hypothetical protein
VRVTALKAVVAVSALFGLGLGASHANGRLDRREFCFTRAVFSGYYFSSYGPHAWTVDYPKADRQLMIGIRRLAKLLDASGEENAVRLDDPNLDRFPFIYAVEVGHMSLTEAEVQGLRRYLHAGGFLFVDDFWGSQEWQIFESQMRRVLPGSQIVELPLSHPLFSTFYEIKEILQVPNVGNAKIGQSWEKDGYEAHCRGIFDERGRLMMLINWNTDLGDAWEWADDPEYPVKYSAFAYQLGVNAILYAMSH